jgi:hypothetical protein
MRLPLARRIAVCLVALLSVAGLVAAPAEAAVPDRWGFAFVDVPAGIVDPARQAGSWPPGPLVTVSPTGLPGETAVKFPLIASTGGVVHVTAATTDAAWCQVRRWGPAGPDLLVYVRCHKFGGAPVFVPFSIVYGTSSGPLPAPEAFANVFFDGANVVSQYNSSGGVNTVTPLAVGIWRVVLNGLPTPSPEGNIQVTAVDPRQPARCKVRRWLFPSILGQVAEVACHNAVNTPLRTGWTLTYQRQRSIFGGAIPPKNFAYTFDNQPANPGPYAPLPVGINFNSQGSVNTIQAMAPGMRLVRFPLVGATPGNVQITAFGPGPEFCNMFWWGLVGNDVYVRVVSCYSGLARVNTMSHVTYTSEL